MSEDPRLPVLLQRWEESRRHGAPVPPEELCRECPELIDELRRRVEGITQCPRDTDPGGPRDAVPTAREANISPTGVNKLGGFKLLRTLGEGGMGVVYEAEDLGLGRHVALKMLRPELADEAFRKRFLREARAAAALRHDHIVTVYQVGQEGDAPFLVMEYLEGETLETRLQRQHWLPLPEALRIARQIAEGLSAAHAKGLIHRDIKPANVWLEKPHDRVKLLDFGLARTVRNQSALTAHGMIVGTPGFMAPEQIFAGPLDARTDLYSLGCVLFRMVTGQLPHESPDTQELLEKVISHEPPNLDRTEVNIPAPVGALLKQMLARDPKDRPMNAEIVAAQLRELERSSLALPRAAWAPASAVTPPRRVGFGVWAGALTILAAALFGLASQYHRWFGEADADQRAAGVVLPTGTPIRIGVLHSLSGTFSGSERSMVDAIGLAVEEINRVGGVLNRPVEMVIEDTHSDEHEFSRLAEKLLTKDKVSVIFGCWSSSARKRVAAVVEKNAGLLVFSSNSEGLEESPNTVYVSGAPNQQLQPAAKWAYAELHRSRYYLVGSDYLYSRACNEILKDILGKLKAEIVGEDYVPLAGTEFGPVVERIKASKADVIMNTVDGSSNLALFQALRAQGVNPHDLPTIWLSLGDGDMASLRLRDMVGDYAAASYFQSADTSANVEFVKRFRARYPGRTRIGDSSEASYCAVYLWKKAVERARSTAPLQVREGFRGATYEDAPEGPMRIDERNLHAWRMARFARMNDDLQWEILFTTAKPVAPEPFPNSRSKIAWMDYVNQLNKQWGGHWEAPRNR
jgi:urea transport system substrate-binding protein